MACTSAMAVTTHSLVSWFGPSGPESGAFGNEVRGVAVDPETGNVYVYDNSEEGSVRKFDSAGHPVNFSSLGTNVLTHVGAQTTFAGVSELAFSSSGATKGDLYVDNYANVNIYNSATGAKLGELNSGVTGLGLGAPPWGNPCGVAVDPTGHVYVGLESGSVNKYTPAGSTATNADYTSSLWSLGYESCNLAADSSENVYVVGWTSGTVTKYAASQFNKVGTPGVGTVVDVRSENGTTLAVDPSTNDVYIDEHQDVAQYNSAGKRLGVFANAGGALIGGSYGIAVTGAAGSEKVYVSDSSHLRVDIFGPGLLLPEVITGEASNIMPRSVTIAGEVNPEGTTVSGCAFAYGTSSSFGSLAPCVPGPPLTGSALVPVHANLAGLGPGATYHYRLSATNVNGTEYGAEKTVTLPAAGPTVNDKPPAVSNISRSSALLTGTIDPDGLDTKYRFVYGTTEAYGSATPITDAGSGSVDETAGPVLLSELQPGTTYHYALFATNALGAVTGLDHTFTTAAGTPPIVTSESGEATSATTATIRAQVNPNCVANLLPECLPTDYFVEVGLVSSTGAVTYNTTLSGTVGTEPRSLEFGLTHLLPGMVYRYRIKAVNQSGPAEGPEQSFGTPGFPTPTLGPPPLRIIKFSEPRPLVCKKGFVKKHGKCVRKKHSTKRHGAKRRGRKK